MSAIKTFKIPLYYYPVKVIITKDIPYSYKKIFKEEYNQFTLALHTSFRGTSYVFLSPTAGVDTVSHECYHVLKSLYSYYGIEKEDEEATAYLLGYIILKVNQCISKYKRDLVKSK